LWLRLSEGAAAKEARGDVARFDKAASANTKELDVTAAGSGGLLLVMAIPVDDASHARDHAETTGDLVRGNGPAARALLTAVCGSGFLRVIGDLLDSFRKKFIAPVTELDIATLIGDVLGWLGSALSPVTDAICDFVTEPHL